MPGNETPAGDTSTLTGVYVDMDISIPCDHHQHSQDHATHADGNEHYITVVAPCGHNMNGSIFVVCWRWIEWCRASTGIKCAVCDDLQPFDVANKVIGPVKDFLK